MPVNTYMTLIQNEVRAVSIKVRDQDDTPFIPDAAYSYITDEGGNILVSEAPAFVYENEVSAIIDDTVTSIPGIYYIVWKINKYSYIYYHKSIINVETL